MAHERSVRWFNFMTKQEERRRREEQRRLREAARDSMPINGNDDEEDEAENEVEVLMERHE